MERAVLAYPVKLWSIDTEPRGTGIRYRPKMSPQDHSIPLVKSQYHIINPTNPGGAFYDRIEHRLHVCGRAADDAEHFRRCRLMLQGLAQFRVPLLQFLEQTYVFNGDDGLMRKSLEERDLFVVEGAHLGATDQDGANGDTLTQ